MKYIFYGAGGYAQEYFDNFRKQYEPFCFVDQAAKEGQILFGLPVLPPSVMLYQYSDMPIIITCNPAYGKLDVQDYLVRELGIAPTRIINYEPYRYTTSCATLENTVLIFKDRISICCNGAGRNPSPYAFFSVSSPTEKIKVYRVLREAIKNALEMGRECACSGCPYLEKRAVALNQRPLTDVAVNFAHTCNLKCSYCNSKSDKTEAINILAYSELLQEMKRSGLIDATTQLTLASGEISIHSSRREIFDMLKEFQCTVFSNCVLFDDLLSDFLATGNKVLNCSVDAGTRETYAMIKGANCFERVLENLRSYSLHGKIILKYIFIEDVNDNNKDVDAFIRLCRELNPIYTQISRDRFNPSPISNNMMNQMARMFIEAPNAQPIRDSLTNDEIICINSTAKQMIKNKQK